jgi:O-antigen/teichoic acid export membrane protein
MDEAYYALLIVSAGQLVNSAMGAPETVMPMIGMEKKFRNIMFLALPLNISINVLLIPIYGYLGCAVASFITLAFWNILGNFMMYRYIRRFSSPSSIIRDIS